MTIFRKRGLSSRFIIPLVFAGLSCVAPAQTNESAQTKVSNFGGAVTIQSKGISTIPNLSLGKPAATFDMKVGRKLTFEPQFRFSLKGEPWAIVFWWRYNASISNKLSLNVSANHSFSFRSITAFTDTTSSSSREMIRTTRYLAGALTPNYNINKYLGIGMYLFYARGIEKFITQNTWMVSFRPTVSNVPVTKNIAARIGPDFYYLKMDDLDGFYFTTRLSVSKKSCPLSISALMTKTLNSTIPSEYDFVWYVGLTYSFGTNYKEAD